MTSLSRDRRRGFTLVEMLIAIIILLVGVVAALKVFPPGFTAFQEAQFARVSQDQISIWSNDLTDNPDSLPDAILPVEPGCATSYATGLGYNDLHAVDFRLSGNPVSAQSWPYLHQYAFTSATNAWPLWEPMSTRVFRRVIGEKVVVPSCINQAGSAIIANFPTYLPRYAPIDGTSPAGIQVYDLKYARKDQADLSAGNAPQEQLFYSMANPGGTATLSFYQPVATATPRVVRISFACRNTVTNQVVQVGSAVWKLTDTAPTLVQGRHVIIDDTGIRTFTMTAAQIAGNIYQLTMAPPADWQIIDNSEQVNRAFDYHAFVSFADLATTPLQSGEYTLYRGSNAVSDTVSPLLFFSSQDIGRKIKLDYVVADWNILHDDVTVDENGYVTLAIPPRIGNRAHPPREPDPWGLFTPLRSGSPNLVMTLFDLRNNDEYGVKFDPARPTFNYDAFQHGYQILNPSLATEPLLVDMADAKRGRVRLGVKDTVSGVDSANWDALAGRTFRVFYRGERDWTMQLFRTPSVFQPIGDPQHLAWTSYAAQGNQVFISGVYAGQLVTVGYTYQELCRVTQSTGNSDILYVDSVKYLHASPEVQTVNIVDPSGGTQSVNITKVYTSSNRVVLDRLVTVQKNAYLVDSPAGDTPVTHLSETHAVPSPNSDGVSAMTLQHQPVNYTNMTVRGSSISLRALWTQPRSGQAYVLTDDASPQNFPTQVRTLNERWQQRQTNISLPAVVK